ncbi:MAG: TonB-dependent receptor [Pseudoxanthomonas sp.]
MTGALALSATLAAQAADEDGQDDTKQLDRIVVTANKRVENVRDVAASISVIGEHQLENSGANSLTDYADSVPGLQVQDTGAPGLTMVSIRGIAGATMSSGATVGTYVDEVPVGSSGIYQMANTLSLDLLPYDISRIEVLRGPQGTLYGAGAMGGLIKYVTRDPDVSSDEARLGFGGSTVQGGGTGWNARFAASVPLVQDRLGLRVSFARNQTPGYTDNAADGRTDINGVLQSGARTALLWDGDTFDLKLSAMHQSIVSHDRTSVGLDPDSQEPIYGSTSDLLLQHQPFSKSLDLYALVMDWDLGWADLVSASSKQHTVTSNQIDASVQYGGLTTAYFGLAESGSAFVRYSLELDKYTEELRLTSKTGGRAEWMLGAFYTKEDGVQNQYVWLGQADGSALPSALSAYSTAALLAMPSTYKEAAVFANGSLHLGERFKIEAGVRESRNRQTYTQEVTEGYLVTLGTTPGSSRDDVFTWSLSPQFRINDAVMLYARAATGYQPGGPNVAVAGMPRSVDSSTLTSYELGLKSSFADGRLQLDVSAFHIDWDDIQIQAVINGIGGLVNGGKATSQGLELATVLHATERLQFGLNAAYTKAWVKNDFEPSVVSYGSYDLVLYTGLAGDRLPYVPRLAWSATGEYDFDLGGGWQGQVGGAFRWVGKRLNDTTEYEYLSAVGDISTVLAEVSLTRPLELRAYHAFDLYAGIGKGAWSLRAYLNNATNEQGWSYLERATSALTGVTSQLRAVPIQPRTFGLEFDLRF